MQVELTKSEYAWFVAARDALREHKRAEVIDTKDGVKVFVVRRTEKKQNI